MKISLNWINDFVDLPNIEADDLANSFTMTTAEVEDVEETHNHLKQIKVAQIKSLRKHPEADKLNLVTFDFGDDKTKEVVCGAPNVREGLKVPYAPLGVTLPNGLTLEPKKIRGQLSEGMLCSEVELGLGEGSKGLMELPASAPLGQSMLDFLEFKSDIVLDVDNKSLTHRPDLWGHYGLAREFACAYEKELKNPFDKSWSNKLEELFNDSTSPIKPSVDKESSCKAYWGLSLDNVQVTKSPRWMVERLEACGLRSINNIVDISNYVMLELGIPLHIFDREMITDNVIHIKKIGKTCEFETLDEISRKLVPEDTVICDAQKPLVLAGIMGGKSSGVKESTTKIFIEVANWKAEEVRTTSTRLGLRTDSSQRYEKSLDSLQCYKTLLRTLDLIKKVCPEASVLGKAEYDGEDLSAIETKTIKTSAVRISKNLGHELSSERIKSIFNALDFKVTEKDGELMVKLPSFRTTKDIEYEACLIEEIGRIVGYDNITPVSPKSDIKATRLDSAKSLHRKIQDFMLLNGQALEVMSYPLIGKKLLEKAKWPTKNEELILVNALSEDADRMRPSLIPHALQSVALNAKNFDAFKFFELGRSYRPDEKEFSKERYQLLIGSYDKKDSAFIDLINLVERLLDFLNINYSLSKDTGKFESSVLPRDWFGSHPHELLNIRIMGKFDGVIASAHPLILRSFKAKGHFSYAVIDLTEFQDRELKSKIKYEPISKFPSSKFDCTVLISKEQEAAKVLESLGKIKNKYITESKIAGVYPLNEHENAVTVTSILEDTKATLKAEDVKACESLIVSTLEKAGYPLKS